ncbi:MAG: hypothetical protein HUJ15_01160, partial [Alcanivorax sp.]|nr:hypothetical protein [Alcanivorax sp.]
FSPGLRVRHTRASFSGQRPLSGEIGVMRPGAETLPAVPQSYRETELALLLGSPDVHFAHTAFKPGVNWASPTTVFPALVLMPGWAPKDHCWGATPGASIWSAG